MESRNDENILISRWTASANEVATEDDSHLELDLKSHLKLQGKATMMLLLELGQYLECTKASVTIPNIKAQVKLDKYASSLRVYGFQFLQEITNEVKTSPEPSSAATSSTSHTLSKGQTPPELTMHYFYPSVVDQERSK